MRSAVHFIPIVTTLVAIPFAITLFRHYRRRPGGLHLLWWALGVTLYGVGTLTESLVTLFGWNEVVFRSWYISGALLGGAPLAQGTVYLLLKRRTAHILATALIAAVVVAATFVVLTPIDMTLVETHRLSGRVMEWTWVRAFSPFINTYAALFLIGGAVLSAMRYRKNPATHHKYVGNVLIAVGALLPGIGGSFTRAGYTEVLYVTELAGLLLIWWGYRWNVRPAPRVVSDPPPVILPV